MYYEDYEYEEFGRRYRGCKLTHSNRSPHSQPWRRFRRDARSRVLSAGPRGGRLMGYRSRPRLLSNGLISFGLITWHDGLACSIAKMFLASSNENPVQVRKSNRYAKLGDKRWFAYVATGKRR